MSHLLHEESPLYGCCFSSSWATQRGGKYEISKRKTIHSPHGSRRCDKDKKLKTHRKEAKKDHDSKQILMKYQRWLKATDSNRFLSTIINFCTN